MPPDVPPQCLGCYESVADAVGCALDTWGRPHGTPRARPESLFESLTPLEYLWRSKFGGMSVSDAKRLRELEIENTRLKPPNSKAECYSNGVDVSMSP